MVTESLGTVDVRIFLSERNDFKFIVVTKYEIWKYVDFLYNTAQYSI